MCRAFCDTRTARLARFPIHLATRSLLLANVGERFVYRPRLRLALMLRKVFHQLLLSSITIEEKFLPGPKRQTTNITVGHTWGVPNKSHDLQVPLCHDCIVADRLIAGL